MSRQAFSPIESEALQIDELMVRVENIHDPQGSLVLEHLKSARAYLLGAMSTEYRTALEQARDSVRTLSDTSLRPWLTERLTALLQPTPPCQTANTSQLTRAARPVVDADRRGAACDLSAFFAKPATSMGVFYPTNYILAIFPSFGAAQAALKILREAGFGDHEVYAADGAELLAFIETLRGEQGIWGGLMTQLSRTFDTEATFVDKDVQWARDGAGFLAVECHSEPESVRVAQLVAPHRPLEMQWYLPGGIRSLV